MRIGCFFLFFVPPFLPFYLSFQPLLFTVFEPCGVDIICKSYTWKLQASSLIPCIVNTIPTHSRRTSFIPTYLPIIRQSSSSSISSSFSLSGSPTHILTKCSPRRPISSPSFSPQQASHPPSSSPHHTHLHHTTPRSPPVTQPTPPSTSARICTSPPFPSLPPSLLC
jgi:hypothetical protein